MSTCTFLLRPADDFSMYSPGYYTCSPWQREGQLCCHQYHRKVRFILKNNVCPPLNSEPRDASTSLIHFRNKRNFYGLVDDGANRGVLLIWLIALSNRASLFAKIDLFLLLSRYFIEKSILFFSYSREALLNSPTFSWDSLSTTRFIQTRLMTTFIRALVRSAACFQYARLKSKCRTLSATKQTWKPAFANTTPRCWLYELMYVRPGTFLYMPAQIGKTRVCCGTNRKINKTGNTKDRYLIYVSIYI